MKKLLSLMLLAALVLSITGCQPSNKQTFDPHYAYLPTIVRLERSDGYKNTVKYIYDDNYHLQTLYYQNYYGEYGFPVTTDSNGNVLSYEGSFQASDDLIDYMRQSYTYTEDGKLLTSATTNESQERTYDSNGLLKSIKRVRSSYVVYIECEHDSSGKLTDIRRYRTAVSKGMLYSHTKLSYNEQGQRTQELRYNKDGVCIYSIQYSYQDGQTIVQMERFYSNGELRNTDTYTFDYCGNLIEDHTVSKDYESTTTYHYEYKKVPISSAPENIFIFHHTLPELEFYDWYDYSNI